MKWLWRQCKRLLVLVLVLVAGLASPVIYVETICRGDATPAPANPLSGETRPEIRTLLTYPEWHIVHAYDDYATVITTHDPHDFDYGKAVVGYWTSLCTLTKQAASLGEIDASTRTLVHVIGVSFSLEMLMKATYEETLGRAATWIRGSDHAPLDDLSARQAAEYAGFLQQVPWYRYDFIADAKALERAATRAFRDRERTLALGLEHRARSAYARLIASGVAATGFDDLTLQMVVSGLTPIQLRGIDGVRVIGPVGDGFEVETPRYRLLTGILATWAAAGATFRDMAGNDQVMFTAISQSANHPAALISLPRQGHADTRHLFLVDVPDLAETLRGLAAQGLQLEHIHDY